MIVSTIDLENWLRFRGQHSTQLQAGASVVVAQQFDDPSRSNWCGKSGFLAALPWALFGVSSVPQSALVSRGERGCTVRLTLSSGATIERSRPIDGPVHLTFANVDGETSSGAVAQAEISAHIGLTKDQYLATCVFDQKAHGWIVGQSPTELSKVAARWFDLSKLERAYTLASERLRNATKRRAELVARIAALDSQSVADGATVDVGELRAALAAIDVERARCEREAAEKEHLVLVGELAARQAARSVVAGFDGCCPVVRLECPARSWVEGNTDRLNDLALDASRGLIDCNAKRVAVEKRFRESTAVIERAKSIEGRIELALAAERGRLAAAEVSKRALAEHRSALAEVEKRIAVLRVVATLLSRKGLQRIAVESRLSEIETLANGLLAECEIPLVVRFSFFREGKGVASHCSACGAPFPRSTRVRECDGCGGVRGPRIIDGLEIHSSDRSGAADDMVGLSISLAASQAIRSDSGSAFGLVTIDEPFGALDESNRIAFASKLSQLVCDRSYGFEQALIVLHQPDLFECFPNRIEIEAAGDWSRLL